MVKFPLQKAFPAVSVGMGGKGRWVRPLGGTVLLLGAMGLTALLYRACMDQQAAGFLHDDGVYVATARVLAEGRGFVLPYLPDAPAQVKYPILYPLILSLAWLGQPAFPANLPLMHWLTTLFAIASILPLYGYLRHGRSLTPGAVWLILMLVFSQFHFMFYATALMSEAPYFFFSVLAIALAEREGVDKGIPVRVFNEGAPPLRQNGNSQVWQAFSGKPFWLPRAIYGHDYKILGLAALSTLAFHTRTIGLSLIVAIFLGLLLRRQWKPAALYLGLTLSVTVLPWGLWVFAHAPAHPDPLRFPLDYVYGGYALEYLVNLSRHPMDLLPAFLERGVYPLMDNLAAMLFPQASFLLAAHPIAAQAPALIVGGLFIALGVQALTRRQFSVSGLYVACYLLMLAFWMYPNQALRFLSVLLPWLWLAVFGAFHQWKQTLAPNGRKAALAVALILVGGLSLWPAVQGYRLLQTLRERHALEPSGHYADLWPEYQAMFAYIRSSVPRDARIAGIWDPMLYLYTDRPAFVLFASALQPVGGNVTDASFARLERSLEHYHVRYALSEPFMLNQVVVSPVNPVLERLRDLYPQRFRPVYHSPHGRLVLYAMERSDRLNEESRKNGPTTQSN